MTRARARGQTLFGQRNAALPASRGGAAAALVSWVRALFARVSSGFLFIAWGWLGLKAAFADDASNTETMLGAPFLVLAVVCLGALLLSRDDTEDRRIADAAWSKSAAFAVAGRTPLLRRNEIRIVDDRRPLLLQRRVVVTLAERPVRLVSHDRRVFAGRRGAGERKVRLAHERAALIGSYRSGRRGKIIG